MFRAVFPTILFTAAAAIAADAPLPDRVRFNEHIRPILSNQCFACHGPDDKHRDADLRLDTREGALADLGGYAAIAPGKPDASELIKRIVSGERDEIMPPPKSKKPKLPARDVALLRKWIEQGAEYEGHWAFLPLANSKPEGAAHPIDAFILKKLRAEGIAPSPPTDPATLARRMHLDLTGLLPTPEEVDAFVKNPDVPALADRLVASPHYGERWGRHWLDQARYADSDGYAPDAFRAVWPYRDWVIRALNDDMPFDRFTIEQLAGDLLPQPTKPQLVATGFHRNTLINLEGGSDPEQFRVEAVMDRVATTGSVWLGLTVGCAQCHTHKFDPISHREYYQLFAFFNHGQDRNSKGATVPVANGEMFGKSAAEADKAAVSTGELETLRDTWEAAELKRQQAAGPKANALILAGLQLDRAARSGEQSKAITAAFEKAEPRAKKKPIGNGDPEARLVEQMIMRDLKQPRETFLFQRGDFTRPDKAGGIVPPGVIAAADVLFPKEGRTFKNRLDLAKWLVDPRHPLTARVTVNRVWMRYFGKGLVETEDDFGTQGTPPSHPELLDWLAGEFVRRGWSMKALHRLIVTSATYRQSSATRPDLAARDPRNLLLARQERLRVEAEIVRDSALCASGLLNPEIGGPGVRPPQPDGVYSFTQNAKSWKTSEGPARFRRGMYAIFYRSAAYPLHTTFDAPNFQTTCTRRIRSNTPLQSLTLANDPAFLEMAGALAARMHRDAADTDARLTRGFRLTLGRGPTAKELAVLRDYLHEQTADFEKEPAAAVQLAPAGLKDLPPHEAAALFSAARVLLNTDNFITRE